MNALQYLMKLLQFGDVVLLSGDFNLPRLKWFTDEVDDPDIAIAINSTSKKDEIVLNTLHELGLYQINKHCNQKKNNARNYFFVHEFCALQIRFFEAKEPSQFYVE